jgi:hypothetical protein
MTQTSQPFVGAKVVTLFKLLSLLIVSTLVPEFAHSANQSVELKPYTARYRVSFHRISAGVLEFSLQATTTPGQFTYSVRAEPSVLARLVVSSQALESSTLQLMSADVRPLQYRSDDGSKGDAKDAQYSFDWEHHRVTGKWEDKPIDLELPPRTQDRQSIQIAVLNDLLADRDPGVYPLLDGDEIKDYVYKHDGAAKIKTAAGEYDAVILRSSRVGSDKRINRYWHAPAINFVPVHAERTTKGSVDLVLDLEQIKITEPSPKRD